MRSTRIAPAALVAALIVPSLASAQRAGVGFPIGEKSRIHTELDVGVGYDSNPDRLSPGTTRSDWKALIRPGLNVDVPGSTFSLGLKSQLTINQYFGTSNANSATTFGALIGANMKAGGRNSVVGFKLDDQLVRTPAYIDDPGTVAAEERRFKEWNNRGTAALILRPGGGALEFNLGYTNTLSLYDDDTGLPFSQRHGALLEAKLRFLPKTAAVFHTDISFFSTEDDASTNVSSPYNITIGLIGQITARISANLAVGFGDTLTWDDGFFSATTNANTRTIIGTAEGTYDINETSRIILGYRRQVQPVILLDNYTRDAIYGRVVVGVGARLAFSLFGQYEFRGYQGGDRDAQILTGDVRADYWFFEFLSAAINYRVLRQSGEGDMAAAGQALLLEDYTRHEVFASVGLRY